MAVPALYGVLAGWWTPRGPVTVVQALAAMVLGLAVGAAAGALLRSRWAALASPVVFVVVLEVVRIGAVGPTVDAPRLGSIYGLLALASGRIFHGVLTVAPMILGALLAAAAQRRRRERDRIAAGGAEGRRRTAARYTRRGLTAAAGVVLLVLAVAVALPARTAPITDAQGRPVPGSVAELARIDVGSHDLAVMIRGVDATNPVLLFLAGGPGGTELGAMRRHSEALEEDFVVVTLDQRGTGRSYDQIEPVSTMTVADAVDDVIAVTEHLRERFGVDEVVLVGQSWGTILGVLAADARPELFSAFVGVGQMVSPRETDRIFYEDTLAWARERGEADLVRALEGIGAPPYDDLLRYPTILSYEQQVYPYDHSVNAEGAGQMLENLPAREYSLLDTVHVVAGLLDTFAILYPQIQGIDLRADVPRLEMPVYLVQGRYEPRGRTGPARDWFTMLDAPAKEWVEASTSGHRPLWEQPELFHRVMTETVLASSS
jgi:pimeloyl-ACP methyl ester carboxylesterase